MFKDGRGLHIAMKEGKRPVALGEYESAIHAIIAALIIAIVGYSLAGFSPIAGAILFLVAIMLLVTGAIGIVLTRFKLL